MSDEVVSCAGIIVSLVVYGADRLWASIFPGNYTKLILEQALKREYTDSCRLALGSHDLLTRQSAVKSA